MKILTIYFSRKGNNYWNGTVRFLERGNTDLAADFIQEATGCGRFEIEADKQYPDNYYACTVEAQAELRLKRKVPVKAYTDDLESCGLVFVGYPNWWGTMPMPVRAFLLHYDWTGKTVAPFCTNEGSGMGRSERDLAECCKGARLLPGLAVRGCEVRKRGRDIAAWAAQCVKETEAYQ